MSSGFGNDLAARLKNSFGEIHFPEACDQFRLARDTVPEILPLEALTPLVNWLRIAPAYQAIVELQPTLYRTDYILDTSARDRILSLLEKGKIIPDSITGSIFSQYLQEGYRLRVIQPDCTLEEVATFHQRILNCIIDSQDQEMALKRAHSFLVDIRTGACIIIVGESLDKEGLYTPRTYMRLYGTISRKQELSLYIDAIEGGEFKWNSIDDWRRYYRGKELLYYLASALYLTQKYPTQELVLGEREFEKLGRELGFQEKEYFGMSLNQRKIGFTPDPQGIQGPFAYHLLRDRTCRVIDCSHLSSYNKQDFFENIRTLQSHPTFLRSLSKCPKKREEVQWYLWAHRILGMSDENLDSEMRHDLVSLVSFVSDQLYPHC